MLVPVPGDGDEASRTWRPCLAGIKWRTLHMEALRVPTLVEGPLSRASQPSLLSWIVGLVTLSRTQHPLGQVSCFLSPLSLTFQDSEKEGRLHSAQVG